MRIARFLSFILLLASCSKDAHIVEHPEWKQSFAQYGIDSACFIFSDHSHERVHLYNRTRCTERFLPASTFKTFITLAALETGAARDETTVIPWDGVHRRPEWDKEMNLREALLVSNEPFFQVLAQRVGRQNMQHFLDTVKYGNQKMGPRADSFWLDGSLKISADEQVGFIRKLYFDELPFLVRSQSMTRAMLLREDSNNNRWYYKTGLGRTNRGTDIYWIVGYLEHVRSVKEPEKSMNKTGVRNYPYFFAMNFERPASDSSQDWSAIRLKLLHELMNQFGATHDE
ncbi:MAG: class D beta-lactamase [Bacteroidetes bacterium]|nr:class D beta-lactamase [Bacteroidota bacterium]